MAKDIPLPPRRPADLDSDQTTSSPDTGDNFYPMSDIPVDEEYQKKLEAGYKTPKKRYSPLKKAKGGMVRGFGIAARGHGKGRMC
jgi:hypothetical protein